MKRLCMIAAAVFLVGAPAFAQAARQQAAASGPVQLQQLQQRITDLYLSDFRSEVELSEEQFLKLTPVIRQFIQMRFRAANRREELKRRQELLLNQPNPSDADVQQLNEEQARFASDTATLESRFVSRLRSVSEISARQALLVSRFNRTFFDERLPALIERARAAAAPRAQPQRPAAARGNTNRGREPARQGNAFGNTGRQ